MRIVPRQLIFPFILVTSLFSSWGFASDITNPMVAAFKNILLISNFESALVQFAFYGGCLMPPLQAAIMDLDAFNLGSTTLSSVRVSFVLPLVCFAVIGLFGFRTSAVHGHSY